MGNGARAGGAAESDDRIDERVRVARDLHDRVVQRLFATSLALQATATLSADEHIVARIERAIAELDEAIREIRTVVFALQRGPHPSGLRDATLDLCHGSSRVLGFEPTLIFGGPLDTLTSDEVAADLLATMREALANVARHAEATAVRVSLDATDHLELRVEDNGLGTTSTPSGIGDGLRNMAARAERWGGALTVEPGSHKGTTVRWRIPFR